MGITSKTFCSSQSPAIYSIARKQKGTNVVLTNESKNEALDAAILCDKQCLFGMVGAPSTMMIPETLVYQVNQLIGCQPDCKLQWDVKSFPSVLNEGPDDGYLLIHALHLEEVNTFMPSEVLKLVLSKLKSIAEKNLNYCIETPVDFVNLQGRMTFLDALTNEVHLNYVTSVAYRICKIELPEDYQLDVDINGHGSMKVCVAGFKMEYKIDALQNIVGACLGLWAACEKLKVVNANPEPPMERPLEKVHSEAWVTHENSIKRVAVARGCALQCAILSPIFKVRELQQHRQPSYLNKAWFFYPILLLLLQSTQIEARSDHSVSYLSIMGVVFLIAIGVIIMIASLCYCIRHCIGEPPAGQPAIAPAPVQLSPLFPSSHHLDAATIQTFAEIPFRAGEGDDSCTICLQSYTDGEFLRGLPSCPHRYHHKCIEQWLTEESTSCPQCKYDYIDQLVPIRSPV